MIATLLTSKPRKVSASPIARAVSCALCPVASRVLPAATALTPSRAAPAGEASQWSPRLPAPSNQLVTRPDAVPTLNTSVPSAPGQGLQWSPRLPAPTTPPAGALPSEEPPPQWSPRLPAPPSTGSPPKLLGNVGQHLGGASGNSGGGSICTTAASGDQVASSALSARSPPSRTQAPNFAPPASGRDAEPMPVRMSETDAAVETDWSHSGGALRLRTNHHCSQPITTFAAPAPAPAPPARPPR